MGRAGAKKKGWAAGSEGCRDSQPLTAASRGTNPTEVSLNRPAEREDGTDQSLAHAHTDGATTRWPPEL